MATREETADAALEADRKLVLALGGFALEIAGAVLVTHEKLPAPRFNFVLVEGVGRERQTAFFERSLDHYFQRAIRPTFRVPEPVPEHIALGLERFGFRPAASRLVLMLDEGPVPPAALGVDVRPAVPEELDLVASFWAEPKERPELSSALAIATHHPNPFERLVPLLARIDGDPVAAALVYRYDRIGGIHLVTTRPDARGRGAASTLLTYARTRHPAGAAERYSIFADSEPLKNRLEALGFASARSFIEYRLPPNAELSLPSPGPPGPPRWRPPR